MAAHKVGGTEQAQAAVSWTTRALDRLQLSDTDKGKAHYRRALAYIVLKEEDNAEQDLSAARGYAPGDQNIAHTLEEVRATKKAKRDLEKRMYSKLFA